MALCEGRGEVEDAGDDAHAGAWLGGRGHDAPWGDLARHRGEEEGVEEELGPTKREKKAMYLAQREKAAMVMSQLAPDHDARFAKLIETFSNVKSVYVDLKRYLLMGVAANATKADVEALQAACDQTKGSKRLAYWGEEVRMLTEWAAVERVPVPAAAPDAGAE